MGSLIKSQDAPLAPQGIALAYRLHDAVYLNVTSRCTLRCRFCPKFHGIWTVHNTRLRIPIAQEPSVAALVAAAHAHGAAREYVFCGLGEPTTRLAVVLSVASILRREGQQIRLNTDGLANLLQGRNVTPELQGHIDHVSISLNASQESTYRHLCRPKMPGSFTAMLAFAEQCRKRVPRVTLTAIEGLEGVDITACHNMARTMGVEFRARPLEATDGRTFRVR